MLAAFAVALNLTIDRCEALDQRGEHDAASVCLITAAKEAHDANDEEFGLDRLEELVASIRTRSSEEIGREVLARVTEWGPGEQDDRTVVIVKALNP